jgi:hypothetical protein
LFERGGDGRVSLEPRSARVLLPSDFPSLADGQEFSVWDAFAIQDSAAARIMAEEIDPRAYSLLASDSEMWRLLPFRGSGGGLSFRVDRFRRHFDVDSFAIVGSRLYFYGTLVESRERIEHAHLVLQGLGAIRGVEVDVRCDVEQREDASIAVSVELEEIRLAQRLGRTTYAVALRSCDGSTLSVGSIRVRDPRSSGLRRGLDSWVVDPHAPGLAESWPDECWKISLRADAFGMIQISVRQDSIG